MVIISFGVPGRQRSSRMVPPASSRNWTVRSTGPCPMSALPSQVPTRVFMRSNSGEAGFGLTDGSLALSHAAPASINVAQTDVIIVFIGFSFVVVVALSSTRRTRRAGEDIGFWDFFGRGTKDQKDERAKGKDPYASCDVPYPRPASAG